MNTKPLVNGPAEASFLRILLGHNHWATSLLVDSCAALTDEQLHRRFDIGPGTIHDTLRHIIGAMLRWADRIAARPVRPSIEDSPQPRSVGELRALLDQAAVELDTVAREIGAADLWHEPIEFADRDGKRYRFSRAAAMMHVLTHGVHHRAQVVHLRKCLGLPPLGLDLDPVEWECVQTGQLPAS